MRMKLNLGSVVLLVVLNLHFLAFADLKQPGPGNSAQHKPVPGKGLPGQVNQKSVPKVKVPVDSTAAGSSKLKRKPDATQPGPNPAVHHARKPTPEVPVSAESPKTHEKPVKPVQGSKSKPAKISSSSPAKTGSKLPLTKQPEPVEVHQQVRPEDLPVRRSGANEKPKKQDQTEPPVKELHAEADFKQPITREEQEDQKTDMVDSEERTVESNQNATSNGTTGETVVFTLQRFNRSDSECTLGCSPSGVPYALIRQRPKLSTVVKTKTTEPKGFTAQKPFHSPSGVSYESIRNRPVVDFTKKKREKRESAKVSVQKPFHTTSGIPYADIRQRLPLPEWYFMRLKAKSGEKRGEGSMFAPTDHEGLRPVDESLYTDPVLLGQPEDFFDGGQIRNRDYLRRALHLNSKKQRLPKSLINTIVLRLKEIYHRSIRPLETLFKYDEMDLGTISEATISAKPMVLFLGPWSTGKSTMINWFVGLPKANQLYTGTQPTTTGFTAIMAGDHPRTVEGIVLAADSKQPFSGLEQFGTQFLEKFQGLEYPSQLLERITLVDTPGIIENRHKQERGYPFNDVTQWFIDRAHLIVLVFDPTKLDVGSELETLFHRLKGHESQLRLFLNKADSIPMQELMRVYGALFWNLAPHMNVTEPPRVYTGSCWWKTFNAKGINAELFLNEETNLLNDINDVIENQLHNKIATLRQHAIKVRTHALLVDRYLYMWNKNKEHEKFQLQELIDKPEKFHIHKYVQHHANVSKYDLPEPSKYRDLFEEHPLSTFRSLESLCSLFAGCPIEILENTIRNELPNLINTLDIKIKEHQTPDLQPENSSVATNETASKLPLANLTKTTEKEKLPTSTQST